VQATPNTTEHAASAQQKARVISIEGDPADRTQLNFGGASRRIA